MKKSIFLTLFVTVVSIKFAYSREKCGRASYLRTHEKYTVVMFDDSETNQFMVTGNTSVNYLTQLYLAKKYFCIDRPKKLKKTIGLFKEAYKEVYHIIR
jgi:hypothetical protein